MFCLIRPPVVETFRFVMMPAACPPLGLAYIAGALERAGHEVHVIDAVGEAPTTVTDYYRGFLLGLRISEIVARIPAEAKAVGISVIFTHEWPAVSRLIELIKEARPELPVILGGEHVTSMPEFSLETSKADYLVLGEGEETVVELAAAIARGGPVDGIPGLAYRNASGGVAVNARRARKLDVDAVAPPSWGHFRLRVYHENRFSGGLYSPELTVPILATRGCPYECTYCSSPNMWTTRWVPRRPELVADEIEGYVRRLGARNFPFQDLTAIIRKDWIVAFCREIIRRRLDIMWQLPSGTRSEAVDDEVAGLLKESGMASMAYAPESGSDETRLLIKKRMTADKLFASIDASSRAGLNVNCFLVIGFPHDTQDHLGHNLRFLDRLARSGVRDVGVGYYMALPGTELFRDLARQGKIRLDRAYFRHILDSHALVPSTTYSPSLSRLDMARWKYRMLRRFYGASRPGKDGPWGSLRRAASGLLSRDRQRTKLEAVARRGLASGLQSLRAASAPRWLDRRAEAALFESWERTGLRQVLSDRRA